MRQGIKILGLTLLAALSLMAVTAVAAQAETGELLIEGKGATESEVEKEEVPIVATGEKGKLVVPGLGLVIACEKGEATGTARNKPLTKPARHIHLKIKILYFGCAVEGNKFCKVYPTEADRNAKTNAGHITADILLLHRLVTLPNPPTHRLYLLIESLIGAKNLTTVFFSKSTEGCTLPTAEITGMTAVVLPEPSTYEEAVSHTLEPLTANDETAEMANAQFFYGGEKAVLEGGKATAKLAGTFENKKWSLSEK